MLLFKITYSYKLRISLILKQAKKINKMAKKKSEKTYIAILKFLKNS